MTTKSVGVLGKPITVNISNILRKYTGHHDRAETSIKTKVGISTIRDVVYRKNPLTESNSRAIIDLSNRAILNCAKVMRDASAAKIELEDILNKN